MTAADVPRLCGRLAAAAPIFFAPVDPTQSGNVVIEAVVADLFRERASRPARSDELAALRFPQSFPGDAGKARRQARRHLGLVLVASWLLHDEAFAGMEAERLLALLGKPLRQLSKLVIARAFVEDAERREELVRTCLAAFAIAPAGESPKDAQDRLEALDSVRRTRLLKQARAREEAREEERKKKLAELRAQEEEAARQAARATFED
jgi:hypothetical protein